MAGLSMPEARFAKKYPLRSGAHPLSLIHIWELIATKAEYYASDTYVFIDGSTEGCRLLGWGQQQVSVYRAEDGYHLSYLSLRHI